MPKLYNILFLSAIILLSAWNVGAQHIQGRVVSAEGGAVEYVTIGITDSGIGVISDEGGRFCITIPDSLAYETLTVSHVSYQPTYIPLTDMDSFRDDDGNVVFRLEPREHMIADVNVYAKKGKLKKLSGRGTRIPVAVGMFENEKQGRETGTLIDVEKTFLINSIEFTVLSNSTEGIVMRVNIYSVEDEKLTNILYYPIYVTLDRSGDKVDYLIEPEEAIVLGNGSYYVSLQFVSTPGGNTAAFPIYKKKSYARDGVADPLEKSGINPGLLVKGYELQ